MINRDTAYFIVRGLSLGTASLTFTASATGKGSATSRPRDIQVRQLRRVNDGSNVRFKVDFVLVLLTLLSKCYQGKKTHVG